MNNFKNKRLPALQTAIQNTKEILNLSGLAVAVAYGRGPIETIVVGTDDKGQPLAEDSLFPIASITKLSVALAILRLADRGLLSVSDPLAKFLPDAVSSQSGITLKQLLTHSAGLPDTPEDAWKYDISLNWKTQSQVCLQINPKNPPGIRVAYSSLDYGLLAITIERITGQPFHEAIAKLVIQPLGIEAYLSSEPPRLPAYVTDSLDTHVGTSLEEWNSPFWRSLGEPWGGMVTTPSGSLSLLRAYQGLPDGFLSPEIILEATQDQTGGLGGGFEWQEWAHCPWGLGPWIITENMNHFAFPNANSGTLCHTGYSGCVVYRDSTADVSWAIHGTQSAADDWYTKAMSMISIAVLASAIT